MVYLGIHVGHGASASLMIDGKIILAFQKKDLTMLKIMLISYSVFNPV